MTFSITNQANIKHSIRVYEKQGALEVIIIRMAPMVSSIRLNLAPNLSYVETMDKIWRVTELDHGLWEAMKKHLEELSGS